MLATNGSFLIYIWFWAYIRLIINIPIVLVLPSTPKESGWKVYMFVLYTWNTWKMYTLAHYHNYVKVILPPCCCSIMYTQTFVPLVASIHVCIDSCIWSWIFMSVLFINALYYQDKPFPCMTKWLALASSPWFHKHCRLLSPQPLLD